jgi:hypothetical protein
MFSKISWWVVAHTAHPPRSTPGIDTGGLWDRLKEEREEVIVKLQDHGGELWEGFFAKFS